MIVAWMCAQKAVKDRINVQQLQPTYKLESAICLSLLELIQGN